MAKICVHSFVSGKVQGVWFRQSTKEQALKQDVTGWAKNLSDGRVEVLLCGDVDAVGKVQWRCGCGRQSAVLAASWAGIGASC